MSTTSDVYHPDFDFGDPRPIRVESLDQALAGARGLAVQLAGLATDPEAVVAYRWLAEQLGELRDDAATVGGLEP